MVLLTPYALVFMVFVLFPWCTGCGSRAIRQLRAAVRRPGVPARVFNTLAFLILAHQLKMMSRWSVGFFVVQRTWIKWLSLLFISRGRCRRSRRSCRSASC
jgi:multiple sugar transport system permease protein